MLTRPQPIVISMAFNGYQWKWQRAITSHIAYCERHGYQYFFAGNPAITPLKMECAWLKLPLLIAALKSRPWALYVDCDAVISLNCPMFESVDVDDKNLYLVNGFSGRPNSGVILAKSSPDLIALLEKILANALRPIPREDSVGWGENGHIIHFVKGYRGLQILPSQWNNNRNPDLPDYIRHFSAGPMRRHYRFTAFEHMAGMVGRVAAFFAWLLALFSFDRRTFHARLENLMKMQGTVDRDSL